MSKEEILSRIDAVLQFAWQSGCDIKEMSLPGEWKKHLHPKHTEGNNYITTEIYGIIRVTYREEKNEADNIKTDR